MVEKVLIKSKFYALRGAILENRIKERLKKKTKIKVSDLLKEFNECRKKCKDLRIFEIIWGDSRGYSVVFYIEGYGWNINNPESFYDSIVKEWGVDFSGEENGFRLWVDIR
jgi:hypothetical protein